MCCETEASRCYECGEVLKDPDTRYEIGNGEYICEDCRDDYYYCCDNCYELVHVDNIIAVDYDSEYVCESCADNYYTCDHCGGLFSDCHISVNSISITLCDNCYSEYYFTCPGCDEVYHQEDGEYINDELYCESCAEDRRGSILPYSYKPNPIFYGGNAGYGVELEIDDGEYKEEAAEDINKAGKGHIYLKEDGSLSYAGFEIVTHPATLDYHVNRFPWTDICEAALSYGYRSHDTDTCGLHVHASRSLFGDTETEQDLTIAKIILLVDRWYDTYIVRFARRDISKMRQWANKPNAGIKPEDGEFDAVHKSKKSADNRYKAVNLCNRNTIEFRFFRGTLKRDTIIASIQWVNTIIQYCRNAPLKDLFNTTWDNIFGNTEHTELTNYLKQRNLYSMKEDN
jgi:formylmethanofuran dehydrogenase subunit E